MALITCPECGQKVSELAKICVHCGNPLDVKNGEIKVKCQYINGSLFNAKITNDHGVVLASIPQRGVATFTIQKDEKVTISFGFMQSTEGVLEYKGQNNYEISVKSGFFLPKLVFNKVDHIDSE